MREGIMVGKSTGRSQKAIGPNRKFKIGDRERWDSSGGKAEGKVVEVATTGGKVKDFEYKTSPDDPRYFVKTDKASPPYTRSGN
jgi:hypothetical protein